MSLDEVQHELISGGLHEESVKRLLNHYQSMRTRMREGEYDEAGTHIGNFCENSVNIILDVMGEDVQTRPSVGTFVKNCISGKYGSSEPKSVRVQIPNTIRAAYDIRNNRDSVHVNLTVPVNKADTQAGIAMCSWILAELLRVYGSSSSTDDMATISNLIDEISEPISDKNPLESLVKSPDDIDRDSLIQILEGRITIVGGEIKTLPEYDGMATDQQLTILMLARHAAVDLGHLQNVGESQSWYSDRMPVTRPRAAQIIGNLNFASNDQEKGGAHIPSHRIDEAIAYLQSE